MTRLAGAERGMNLATRSGCATASDVRPELERIVLGCPCSLFFNPQLQIRPDTWSRLHMISAPTLVLVGELDTSDFQAASQGLHENIPGAVKRVIAGAGHMANMDEPESVLGMILDFLRLH